MPTLIKGSPRVRSSHPLTGETDQVPANMPLLAAYMDASPSRSTTEDRMLKSALLTMVLVYPAEWTHYVTEISA
jgi:hypothetical protein